MARAGHCPRKSGCALLEERAHALDLILGVEEQLECLAFKQERSLEGGIGPGLDHLEDRPHRQLRHFGDGLCELQCPPSAAPSAVTSETSPIAKASSPLNCSPVRRRRRVRYLPMRADHPLGGSGTWHHADADLRLPEPRAGPATIRSQLIASSQPPPVRNPRRLR